MKIRRWFRYSQEDFGKIIGVTRQTVAKWESGESVPDILTAKRIAEQLDIPIEDLLNYEKYEKCKGVIKGPPERYFFGKVQVGNSGKVTLPKEALEKMKIKSGDELLVLGDIERGIEFLPANVFWECLFKK